MIPEAAFVPWPRVRSPYQWLLSDSSVGHFALLSPACLWMRMSLPHSAHNRRQPVSSKSSFSVAGSSRLQLGICRAHVFQVESAAAAGAPLADPVRYPFSRRQSLVSSRLQQELPGPSRRGLTEWSVY